MRVRYIVTRGQEVHCFHGNREAAENCAKEGGLPILVILPNSQVYLLDYCSMTNAWILTVEFQ
jgi:hypothetical protein